MSDYIDEAFDSDDVWKKNGALRKASKEIERLRAALKRISELDVPRTVHRAWRQDGAPSRHDACPHDLRMYEDCYACIAEYAGAVLERKEKGDD